VNPRFDKWVRLLQELAGHAIVTIFLLFTFRIIELVVDFLWGKDSLLFGLFPWKYLTSAADAYIFISFVLTSWSECK
jgi:hypothetical protein